MEDINSDVSQQQNGGDHVSIEIADINKILAASIKGKLNDVSPSLFGRCCCVYRVHEKFRKINEYAYTPEMVSIGPFHRSKVGLQAMEEHKLRYLRAFLSRTTTPEEKLEECVESIRRLEEEARKSYSEPIDLNSDNFVEMMVVDGVFVSELLRKSAGEVKIERDDPVLNNIWGMASLVRDMILLENQLPMCVLARLFNITMINQEGLSLTELALRFFNYLMPREDEVLKKYSDCEGKHLLDLLGKTLHVLPRETETNTKLKWKFLPCVTELRQAGVKFKKGSTMGSFLDIKFSDGVLEIPPVLIQDQTDSLLRNLIASEQSCDGRATYMTSYAFLMDSLINSPNDVGFLRHHGIITNYLGDDEDVSQLFNKLCSEVTLANFYYSKLCDQVNEYYKARWHVWRATLKRDYFNSPWAVLSFIAAILLLVLTFTSTLFSILSFFIHKS